MVEKLDLSLKIHQNLPIFKFGHRRQIGHPRQEILDFGKDNFELTLSPMFLIDF